MISTYDHFSFGRVKGNFCTEAWEQGYPSHAFFLSFSTPLSHYTNTDLQMCSPNSLTHPPSYIQCASVVGMYSTPPLHYLLPSPHNTPLTRIIANCVMLLILTSALPLTSKTLGMCMSHDFHVIVTWLKTLMYNYIRITVKYT